MSDPILASAIRRSANREPNPAARAMMLGRAHEIEKGWERGTASVDDVRRGIPNVICHSCQAFITGPHDEHVHAFATDLVDPSAVYLEAYMIAEIRIARPQITSIRLTFDGDRELWLMQATVPSGDLEEFEFQVMGDPDEVKFVNVDDPGDVIRFEPPSLALTYRDPDLMDPGLFAVRVQRLAAKIAANVIDDIDADELSDTISDILEEEGIRSETFEETLDQEVTRTLDEIVLLLQQRAGMVPEPVTDGSTMLQRLVGQTVVATVDNATHRVTDMHVIPSYPANFEYAPDEGTLARLKLAWYRISLVVADPIAAASLAGIVVVILLIILKLMGGI